MKRVAVCFFGQPRFVKKGKILREPFLANLEIDYYAHFWKSHDYNFVENYFDFRNIIYEDQKVFSFEKKIKDIRTTQTISNTISPLYSMSTLNSIIDKTESYDYIIVTRTDVVCLDFVLNKLIIEKDTLYTDYVYGDEWNINDNINQFPMCFFLFDKKNIKPFFSLYKNLDKYLFADQIPLCHHRLMAHHLKKTINNFKMIKSKKNRNYSSFRRKVQMILVSIKTLNFEYYFSKGGWYIIREDGLL